MWPGYRWGRRSSEREDDLPNLELVTFFDTDLFHDAANRGRHFDDSLISFEFQHRLAFRHFRSGRDHEPDEVALFNIFPKFRETKLRCATGLRLRLRRR